MFYFENTPDPQDVKALAEAEGVKIANLKALKELRDMDGIEKDVYEDAVSKFKSEKTSILRDSSLWGFTIDACAVYGFSHLTQQRKENNCGRYTTFPCHRRDACDAQRSTGR